MRFGAFVALGLLLLAGCGVTPTTSTQEVSVLGVVEGTPESPTLLGRSLDLNGASVQDEWGRPRSLLPGIVAEVQGRVEGQTLKVGRATAHFHLEGPVKDVDLANASFSVLGRTVFVNAHTRIYEESAGSYTTLVLGDLRPGDWVEVSGTPDNQGNLIATYVERKRSSGQVELVGYVCHLDTASGRFDLYPASDCASGTPFQVDYQSAEVEGVPTEGVWAKVEGSLNGSLLVAREVHFYNSSPSPAPSYLELKGPIANLDTASKTFSLLGYVVDYSAAKVEGTLQEGAYVEVKGQVVGPGQLRATEVEVKYPGGSGSATHEVKGTVEAVDPVGQTLRVGGLGFYVDASTVIKRDDTPVTLQDIRVEDWVEVHYNAQMQDPQGNFYATKVEVKGSGSSSAASVELKGPVANLDRDARTFTLMGYGVAVDGATRYEVHDSYVSAEEFWGVVQEGDWVEAEGTLTGNTLLARELELKR